MRKFRTISLLAIIAVGVMTLSGCDQVDSSIIETPADLTVNISVPYATATPLPEYLNVASPVVIDPNGGVTVNDTSLFTGTSRKHAEVNTAYQTLSLGDTGFAVQTLQERLQELGYLAGGVSGIFDANTERAVKRFEQTFGIMQTGIATPAFQTQLFASTAPIYLSESYETAVVSQYTTLQKGAVGSSVYALQHRLRELGYPVGELTGTFDDTTANAVALFYINYGMQPNGVAYVAMQRQLFQEDARTYTGEGAVTYSDDSLVPGNVGTLVLQIQNRLIQLGYMNSVASGIYDDDTVAAVQLFQEACSVEQTGRLPYALQAILLSDQAPAYGSTYNANAVTYTDLSEGSEGEEVTALQNRLIELGYATGAGNGLYGTETTTAVRMFQHYNSLEETGIATAYVQSCMYSPTAITYQDVLNGITAHESIDTTTPEPTLAPVVNDVRTLSFGESGDDVDALQGRLFELGYTCPASGVYDETTMAAVQAFQAAIGMSQTGEATPDLQRYLQSRAAPGSGYQFYNATQAYTTLQEGDSGESVTNLQRRLWELGYLLTESVEGYIGTYHNGTRLAVAAAQVAMGYEEADGIASAEFQCFILSQYGDLIKK